MSYNVFCTLADDLMRYSQPVGLYSILPKEHNGTPFFKLQLINTNRTRTRGNDGELTNTAVWDSSIHDSSHLNRLTGAGERIFLIIKVYIRLSHPAIMDVILRKRIAINVYKKQSITKSLFKRISRADMPLLATGVTYEIVSSIPKASEDIEDRESLALLAASGVDLTACDGESYIERYTKSVSAVESVLALDRLRQEVAVRELLAKKAKLAMQTNTAATATLTHGTKLSVTNSEAMLRKTVSVPNMAQHVEKGNKPAHNKQLRMSVYQAVPSSNTATSGAQEGVFDLGYFASAADKLKQKASNLFGSMTGLNLLGQEEQDQQTNKIKPTPNSKCLIS